MTVVQPSFEDLGTPLHAVTFCVVDLETTGLSPTHDRITEVGAVKVRGGETLGEFQSLVHPGIPIPPQVSALTGISDWMVRDAPPVGGVLPAFLEFAHSTVFVAHNARFDLGFLRAELERHGFPPLDPVVVDTARLARRLLRDEVRDARLSTLAAHLHSRVRPAHRALPDARATVDVLHGLLERAGSLGVLTVEDLRDYARSTSDPAFRKVRLVADAPQRPGIYRFLDRRGEVLYVGRAGDLRARLRRYFGQDGRRRIAAMVRETDAVRWEVTPTELEARVREVRAIHAHRPRYNRRSRHPERAVYVKLTREPFPRLSVVSRVRDDGARYVGPTSRSAAERFVDGAHQSLPLRRCTQRLRVRQDHPACLWKDLRRCGAPCDGTQSRSSYGEVAAAYLEAVDGDPAGLVGPLQDAMREAAAEARFERAARARSRLHAVAGILGRTRRTGALVRTPEVAAARRDGQEVEAVLVRHGLLAATARLPATSTHEQVRDALLDAAAGQQPTPPEGGLPARGDAEEVRLVEQWLAADGTRVLWVCGTYSQAVGGGRLLTEIAEQARRVGRAVRRDRQDLAGVKIRRRQPRSR